MTYATFTCPRCSTLVHYDTEKKMRPKYCSLCFQIVINRMFARGMNVLQAYKELYTKVKPMKKLNQEKLE